MKKIIIYSMLCLFVVSCEEQLDIPLSALTTDDVTPNAAFAETLVIGTYATMNAGGWGDAESNWIYGSVASDDAYKGSDANDQSDITQMETWDVLPSNGFLTSRWRRLYEGVTRANEGIRLINAALESGDISEAEGAPLAAELRFLRAHFHFEAKKAYGNIPFIDELTTEAPSNVGDVWPSIEADFEYAIANLPETNAVAGRVGSWAAKSYLAKVHIYQLNYAAAKPILDDIINNGPYALNVNFHDNFNAATNNSVESIFAVQYAINDGAGSGQNNANYGDTLNFPHSNSPFGCCGFHQPSHDLVNAYLVDPVTGLPLDAVITDPALYVKSVEPTDIVGGGPRHADDATFIPDTRDLDPRLDWTVGRKGIPFLGWGDYAGLLWVRDAPNGGPFMGKKNVWENSQDGIGGITGNWGQKLTAINTNIIRYAEVILWRAEIAASEGDLSATATYLDLIRARSANPATFVKKGDGTDAANYLLGLYTPNGGFANQAAAEKAVLMEHRLEMAMEGHRFFDLVRRGKANEVLNAFVGRPQFRSYLGGASYSDAKGIYPIPEAILDLAGGAFTQNPGY